MTTLQRNDQLHGRARFESPAGSALSPGYPLPAGEAREIVRLAAKHRWDVQASARAAQLSGSTHLDQCLETTRNNARLGLQHLWRLTDDDLLSDLGVPRGALRPLTFTVCSAPNLAAAVRRYQEFHTALPGLPPVTVEESAGTARLSFNLASFDTSSLTLVSLGLLAAAHRIIIWATRNPINLHRVELPHARAGGHPGYQMMFRAPALFDADSAALVFDAAVLTRSFVCGHDDIERLLDDTPDILLAESDFHMSVSAQVRRLIEERLGTSSCSSNDIAASVAMSRPTLWRRLREENTSISQIRDQVLREVALASLARGDETVAQLSRRLGFSEPSAFSRAFRRWTGRSPRNYQEPQRTSAGEALPVA